MKIMLFGKYLSYLSLFEYSVITVDSGVTFFLRLVHVG